MKRFRLSSVNIAHSCSQFKCYMLELECGSLELTQLVEKLFYAM